MPVHHYQFFKTNIGNIVNFEFNNFQTQYSTGKGEFTILLKGPGPEEEEEYQGKEFSLMYNRQNTQDIHALTIKDFKKYANAPEKNYIFEQIMSVFRHASKKADSDYRAELRYIVKKHWTLISYGWLELTRAGYEAQIKTARALYDKTIAAMPKFEAEFEKLESTINRLNQNEVLVSNLGHMFFPTTEMLYMIMPTMKLLELQPEYERAVILSPNAPNGDFVAFESEYKGSEMDCINFVMSHQKKKYGQTRSDLKKKENEKNELYRNINELEIVLDIDPSETYEAKKRQEEAQENLVEEVGFSPWLKEAAFPDNVRQDNLQDVIPKED